MESEDSIGLAGELSVRARLARVYNMLERKSGKEPVGEA